MLYLDKYNYNKIKPMEGYKKYEILQYLEITVPDDINTYRAIKNKYKIFKKKFQKMEFMSLKLKMQIVL
jgi:hypothetical protein